MATERTLKRFMDRTKLFPDKAEIMRGPIAINKNKLISDRNYAGIIHIIRYMPFYEKDSFLTKLYEKNSDDNYLFILIFGNPESDLYTRAKEKAEKEYQYDIDRMRNDVWKFKDECLSEFLKVHDLEEDYWYVFNLTDNDDERHLSSHKKAADYLINLENSRF